MAIKEWVTFMSVLNVVICFDFRASLQRAIKLMNLALVRRSVEPANWPRRVANLVVRTSGSRASRDRPLIAK
jgi:hypothetical protein